VLAASIIRAMSRLYTRRRENLKYKFVIGQEAVNRIMASAVYIDIGHAAFLF
jgi:hypothetical protein